MAQARAIIINGYEFPIKYNGYKHSRNKIHSANTGRNNNGNMVGTILAIKDKFECELAPITPAQAKQIDDIFNSTTMFFDAKVLCVCGIASKRGDFGAEALWKYKFATKSAIFDAELGRSVRITAVVGVMSPSPFCPLPC